MNSLSSDWSGSQIYVELSSSSSDQRFDVALDYIVDVLLALSMFGCVATVVTFVLFRPMRTQPIKLVVYLCICMFFAQLFFFLTFYLENSIMCIPCAMIFHYFFLADFIWSFSIASNFYQMIVRRNRDAESLEIIYHGAAWAIPMIIVVAMAATKNYNNQGGYCYMESGVPIFLAFFVPGLFIVTSNTIIFIFTVKEIHDTLKSAPNSDKKEKSKEIKVYFSIFASIGLSWLFGFIMVFIDDDVLKKIFLVLFSILTPTQGLLIFFSYCCNERVINRWSEAFGLKPLIDHTSVTSTTASGRLSSTHSGHSGHSGHSHSNHTQNSARGHAVAPSRALLSASTSTQSASASSSSSAAM